MSGSTTVRGSSGPRTVAPRGGNGLSGALCGLALAAFVDESVFHQILGWHHFYDRSTSQVGLLSDGLFHAFSFFAVVAGLFLLAELRRRGTFVLVRWLGALLVAAGAFQLYDGTLQHKVFGLHQIRYGVDLTAYDLTWNIVAVLLIGIGAVLLVRERSRTSRAA